MSQYQPSSLTNPSQRETVFDLLSNALRRDVLAVVCGRDSPADLDEIAETVASDTESTESRGSALDSVRVALHHVHLPKLDEVGVVSYDPEAKTVTPERTEMVAPYAAATSTGRSRRR